MKDEVSLDSLKSAWKNQVIDNKYSTEDIFKMLKRKSVTSVKWIFYISLIELFLGVLGYILLFSNFALTNRYSQLIENLGYWGIVYEIITFIVYGVTFLFIYKFFQSYRSIKVQSSIKELSQDIISFRRVVNWFIYFNLIVIFVLLCILLIPLASTMPELKDMDWTSSHGIIFLGSMLLIFLVLVGIYWLYYFLLYGTFQRRLKRNLETLNSLED